MVDFVDRKVRFLSEFVVKVIKELWGGRQEGLMVAFVHMVAFKQRLCPVCFGISTVWKVRENAKMQRTEERDGFISIAAVVHVKAILQLRSCQRCA